MKPCGFVTNMAEWMTASDVIVTKAGPGTIAEALICGLPIILNGFIPCQVSPPWQACVHACCAFRNMRLLTSSTYSAAWTGGGQCAICGGQRSWCF